MEVAEVESFQTEEQYVWWQARPAEQYQNSYDKWTWRLGIATCWNGSQWMVEEQTKEVSQSQDMKVLDLTFRDGH